jgi:hypothetical protein
MTRARADRAEQSRRHALRLERIEQSRPPTVPLDPWPADHPTRGRPDLRHEIEGWIYDQDTSTLVVSAPAHHQVAATVHAVLWPWAADGLETLCLTLKQLVDSLEHHDSGLIDLASRVPMLVLYDIDPRNVSVDEHTVLTKVSRNRCDHSCRQVIVSRAPDVDLVEAFGVGVRWFLRSSTSISGYGMTDGVRP